MPNKCPSVTYVVNQIKQTLERGFRSIMVEGEISNLSLSSSGHWYFTLSDRDSSLSCALFARDAMRNSVIKGLKDGDKVQCVGSIGVYGKRGTFQLITKQISTVGEGDLLAQYKKLKEKLSAEGLFDLTIKKNIPTYPRRIGVITARGAAALQDFLNVYARRSLWTDILLSPALVQGDGAPQSVRMALQKLVAYNYEADEKNKLDVIVITRGGGSLEDLWAFNDEQLVRDVHDCSIPIISAIGHEVDYTLIDFVADLRCETPSAAAEILSQGQVQLSSRLEANRRSLQYFSDGLLADIKSRVEEHNPRMILEVIQRRIANWKERLMQCQLDDRSHKYVRIHEFQVHLDDLISTMRQLMTDRTNTITQRVNRCEDLLQALGPQQVLNRGFSYVEGQSGQLVSSFADFSKLETHEKLVVNFKDGKGDVLKC